MPQDTLQDPSNWQYLYLRTRALNRSWRQFLLVSVTFLFFMAWVVIVALVLSYFSGYIEPFDKDASFVSRLLIWFRISSPAISIAVGVYLLLNIAQNFVYELYDPALDSKRAIRERIWHRLWGWYGFSTKNFMVIKDTKLEPAPIGAPGLVVLTFLVIMDGFAVYLERGNCFSRVVGAGIPIPYLDARETIKAVVDLRPQLREGKVNAWTNDGIKVTLKIRAEIQIVPGALQSTGKVKLAYPFDPRAVRRAVEYTAVRFRDGKLQEVNWDEGAMGSVTGLLARHVSSHHFDELFMSNEGDGQILSPQVMNALLEKSNRQLKETAGTCVKSLQITDIKIPIEIRHQRLDVWAAEKDSLVSRIRGEAQAYRIRTSEEARARAQRDLIVAIAKSLQQVEPSHFSEPLLLSLSGILDQGLRDPLVQTYMTQGALDSLKRLKELL
jgi:regulator of protease activity HflC (stomatin/prohibitin superfamily)